MNSLVVVTHVVFGKGYGMQLSEYVTIRNCNVICHCLLSYESNYSLHCAIDVKRF